MLCFVRTKHGASRLARQLEKDGLATDAIHGDKTQQARMEALAAFKEGKLQVLVATDVAARGLDIDDLPLVVNYELPHVPEDYIHRIGRTGRAGASGEAISLVAPEEEKYLADIERLLKKKVADRHRRGLRSSTSAAAPRAGAERAARTRGARARAGARAARTRRAEAIARRARRRRARTARATPMPRRARRRAHGDTRREERERAYALNPDQPLPRAARCRRRRRARSTRRAARASAHGAAGPGAADEAHGARAREGLTPRRCQRGTSPIMRLRAPDRPAADPSACR